jgi:transcriptional regulator with XRE-family HTH domain
MSRVFMKSLKNIFAERFKELRVSNGLSQAQMAEKIFINRSAINNYEHQENLPKVDVMMQICQVFGVSADYLLGLDDSKPPIPDWLVPIMPELLSLKPENRKSLMAFIEALK